MKNKLITSTVLASSLLLSSLSYANNVDSKHWSVGAGTYAFSLASDNDRVRDDTSTGFNLNVGYAFNDHFQVRATYFSLEHDDRSDIESTGYDLMAYAGASFIERGFRSYGGLGFFSDEREFSFSSESFSGFQAGGGIGYNWGEFALDFVLKLREADEYEDLFYRSGNYVAISGDLSISYLF